MVIRYLDHPADIYISCSGLSLESVIIQMIESLKGCVKHKPFPKQQSYYHSSKYHSSKIVVKARTLESALFDMMTELIVRVETKNEFAVSAKSVQVKQNANKTTITVSLINVSTDYLYDFPIKAMTYHQFSLSPQPIFIRSKQNTQGKIELVPLTRQRLTCTFVLDC
jgi:SHS2 domain-containing protein